MLPTDLKSARMHFMHWRRKWQPTPVFLPGESQGGGGKQTGYLGLIFSRSSFSGILSEN